MERDETIGTHGELVFASECLRRGYSVFNPIGNQGYDCLVENNGRYKKVQVKTTRKDNAGRYYFAVRSKSKDSEVYVFHVFNTSLFYVVPSEEVRKRKSIFCITPSKADRWLNNWKLFE
jgi:hypothetical protein